MEPVAPRAPTEPTVVRVSSPADILGILPHRLGFHPTESLVVVSLHGPRRRDELVMRFDLPAARHDAEVAEQVVARLRHRGADATLLVCYTEGAPPAVGLARAPLVRALRRALSQAGIPLMDALLVREGRWWSYTCRRPSCCPPEGTLLGQQLTAAAAHYAAEAVGQGAVLRPDRAALERSIEPDTGVAVAGGAQAAAGRDGLALLDRLVARWAEGERALAAADALTVAVALRSVPLRDRAMTLLLDHDPAVLTALFTEVARQVPDDQAAPCCCVLAWFAYGSGDGALARVAAQRALRGQPGYSMAELILEGLDAMAPPSLVREISARVRADLAAAS